MQAFWFFCRKSGTKPCGICRKSGGKNSILCAMPIPFFILRRSINHPILKGICIVFEKQCDNVAFFEKYAYLCNRIWNNEEK